MPMRLHQRLIFGFVTALVGVAPSASAADPARAEDPNIVEARAQYVRGNDLARTTQWAQALAAFERSYALRAHPLTIYNMGVCERALGRMWRAQELFTNAITTAEKDPKEFPASRLEEARGYLGEVGASLVHLDVTVDPPDALLGADGRPLQITRDEGGTEVIVAGAAKPGAPEAIPRPTFPLIIDPGTHVFRVVAKGFADVLLTRTYAPGEKAKLVIRLAELPAAVHVSSNEPESIVLVNGADVGFAPVNVSRPPGAYRIVVRKTGFETFDTKLALLPGQELDLPAKISPEHIPVTKRWYFWAGVIGAVAAGGLLTYALTREDPAPAPYQGGTTGWVVKPP